MTTLPPAKIKRYAGYGAGGLGGVSVVAVLLWALKDTREEFQGMRESNVKSQAAMATLIESNRALSTATDKLTDTVGELSVNVGKLEANGGNNTRRLDRLEDKVEGNKYRGGYRPAPVRKDNEL